MTDDWCGSGSGAATGAELRGSVDLLWVSANGWLVVEVAGKTLLPQDVILCSTEQNALQRHRRRAHDKMTRCKAQNPASVENLSFVSVSHPQFTNLGPHLRKPHGPRLRAMAS
ncbi:hypothetical protein E4U57_001811 [Claviceps arundinis]|uniref:Uncharacterized protein n=1 Tax=Claviceps arundinis TaxID=1623583 RepID=A0ABQ7PL73_9HYPO|nr:hypothetical protein E4U57_001811 [Claviceps arundinis]